MLASIQQVYDQLGGELGVGAVIHSERDMEAALRNGLPFRALGALRENWNLTVVELAASLAIPKSTLMRLLTTKHKRMGQANRTVPIA